jgi:hypothetical protein
MSSSTLNFKLDRHLIVIGMEFYQLSLNGFILLLIPIPTRGQPLCHSECEILDFSQCLSTIDDKSIAAVFPRVLPLPKMSANSSR